MDRLKSRMNFWRNGIEYFRSVFGDSKQDPIENILTYASERDSDFFGLFERFELDRQNPVHRGFVAAIMHDLLDGSRPTPGRPPGSLKWTQNMLMELGEAATYLQSAEPGATDGQVAAILKERLPNIFGPMSVDSIRKRVLEARRVWAGRSVRDLSK